MTEAAYKTGPDAIDDRDLPDALDSFVSHVLATANVMWAAARFDDVNMSEDLGTVANNLHNEAWSLRKRLDKRLDERMEEIYKDRPELLEEEPSHDKRLSDIMWKGQQIEAMFRGIQSLNGDGTSPDADAMDTLAGIARPMINEIRELADELHGSNGGGVS